MDENDKYRLTAREEVASRLMPTLLAMTGGNASPQDVAKGALQGADALLALTRGPGIEIAPANALVGVKAH